MSPVELSFLYAIKVGGPVYMLQKWVGQSREWEGGYDWSALASFK